jgi:hypothetical protein
MSEYKIHNFEQRSPEWYRIREGKITASDISKILGKLSLQKTVDAIENKAAELAIESVHGMIEDDYISFDMRRGIDLEPSAFNLLSEILSQEFIELEKVGFVEVNENVGCSPDAVMCGLNVPCEIKCPNVANFFKLVINQTISPTYYDQIQQQIRCLNAPYGLFFAYCLHRNQEFYYMQKIERNEDRIKLIIERENIVIEKKNHYIEKLKNGSEPITGFIAESKEFGMLVSPL